MLLFSMNSPSINPYSSMAFFSKVLTVLKITLSGNSAAALLALS